MARADTRTLLSLDRWAAIVGLNPRHFNGVEIPGIDVTRICKEVWMQHTWQGAYHVSREDVARAIAAAEEMLIGALGFHPVPIWVEGEVKRLYGSSDVSLLGCSNLMTPAGRFRGVRLNYGHVISGGVRVNSLTAIGQASIAAGTMTWVDADLDGYSEIARIVLPTAITDTNEVRCYFPGEEAADEWEIRPLRSVTIAGGNVTIDIDRHLLVDPDLWEALNPAVVNGTVDASFLAALDVYAVYNDTSDQATLQWERLPSTCDCGSTTCPMCSWQTQAACLQTRDPRLGIVTYQPGTWDETEEVFALATLAIDRQPERISANYRSGYRSPRRDRNMVNMHPDFERIIVLLSMCLLDRPVCGCSNVENFYSEWTEDRSLSITTEARSSRYQVTQQDLNCPWGTKTGQLEAWRMAQRYALGGSVGY